MCTYLHLSAIVIQEPNDFTLCEAKDKSFNCTVNTTNININHTDMQWYRFIYGTSTTEMIVNRQNPDIIIFGNSSDNSSTSVLHITNARQSYTGYYWVGLPSFNVCNVSLTVLTSMLIEFII